MIYLASPYSHPNPAVMQERFEDVQLIVVEGFNRGIMYLSPIMYWHEAASKFSLTTDYRPYLQFNMELLRACTEIHVLTIQGWSISLGVEQEIKAAAEVKIPMHHIDAAGSPVLILE